MEIVGLSAKGPKGLATHNKAKVEESRNNIKAGNNDPGAPAVADEATKDPSNTSPPITMQDFGTEYPDFFHGIFGQMANCVAKDGHVDQADLKFAMLFLKGGKPRDHIEAALLTQMAPTHLQIMRFSRLLSNARDPVEFNRYEAILTKLMRTFVAQVEALKRYRNTNEPGVTVQNVSVTDGGQAIVGNVMQTPGGGVSNKTPAPPLAITDAKLTPMPLLGK
jgi:hypothetical protein